MIVYIQDINGNPMMPTTRHSHVRKLLRDGKAIVVSKFPFTIKLTYETKTSYKQRISLGVDCGTAHVGLSACTEKQELFAVEVKLRTDITTLLSARKECRVTRRNRLRYRKERWENRISKKKKDWIAPSVRHKVDSHIRLINQVCSILPVYEIHLEVGNFDTQKMKNPDINGEEYQQGEQLGFWNVREYVLYRDNHTCQYCKGKSKDKALNVHHIESRKTGGNSPSNLITLCETCHKAYHRGDIRLKIRRGTSLRDAAVMNIFKNRLYEELKKIYSIPVIRTYGYITKYYRIKYNVGKNHIDDARMISKMFNAKPLNYSFKYIKVRRHNRKIYKLNKTKGDKLIRYQTNYIMNGYRLYDIVKYNGKEYYVSSRRTRGTMTIKDIEGRIIKDGVTYRKLKFIRKTGGFIILLRN